MVKKLPPIGPIGLEELLNDFESKWYEEDIKVRISQI